MNTELSKKQVSQLKKEIGEAAYRALRRGGTLNCWRNTTPHNWWVEGKRGVMHWHSSHGEHPSLKFFRLLDKSKDLVPVYWGSDSGLSVHMRFVLV